MKKDMENVIEALSTTDNEIELSYIIHNNGTFLTPGALMI